MTKIIEIYDLPDDEIRRRIAALTDAEKLELIARVESCGTPLALQHAAMLRAAYAADKRKLN